MLPVAAMAEYLPGTITFNDGTTKTGLIDLPKRHNQKEIGYKEEKKAKEQNFTVDEVKEFTVTDKDNKVTKFVTLKLANLKGLSHPSYKIEDKKSWLEIVREGEINIMTAYVISSSRKGPVYYMQKPDEDYCRWLAEFYGGFTANEFKGLVAMVSFNFKDECPNLAESITKEDFKAKGVGIVGIMYEQVCDKTK